MEGTGKPDPIIDVLQGIYSRMAGIILFCLNEKDVQILLKYTRKGAKITIYFMIVVFVPFLCFHLKTRTLHEKYSGDIIGSQKEGLKR